MRGDGRVDRHRLVPRRVGLPGVGAHPHRSWRRSGRGKRARTLCTRPHGTPRTGCGRNARAARPFARRTQAWFCPLSQTRPRAVSRFRAPFAPEPDAPPNTTSRVAISGRHSLQNPTRRPTPPAASRFRAPFATERDPSAHAMNRVAISGAIRRGTRHGRLGYGVLGMLRAGCPT